MNHQNDDEELLAAALRIASCSGMVTKLGKCKDAEFGASGNVFLARWLHNADAPAAEIQRSALRGYASTVKRFGALIILEPGSKAPDAAARKIVADTMVELASQCACVAYALLNPGFLGAAARAAITGLNLIARPTYETKVFAMTPDAITWVCQKLGANVSSIELHADVAAFTVG